MSINIQICVRAAADPEKAVGLSRYETASQSHTVSLFLCNKYSNDHRIIMIMIVSIMIVSITSMC